MTEDYYSGIQFSEDEPLERLVSQFEEQELSEQQILECIQTFITEGTLEKNELLSFLEVYINHNNYTFYSSEVVESLMDIVFKNRLYIEDLDQIDYLTTHLQVSFDSIHTIHFQTRQRRKKLQKQRRKFRKCCLLSILFSVGIAILFTTL